MQEQSKERWAECLRMFLEDIERDVKLFCTKRLQWIDNGFHSDFCRECWNLYMFEFYWEQGLGKYRHWCLADNCVNEDVVEFVLQKHPEWKDTLKEEEE